MPRQLLRDGFGGDVDVYSNSITFTIVHPSADIREVKQSLDITLKEIELRLKSKNNNVSDINGKGRPGKADGKQQGGSTK
jgi:hypothetical protein